jgi:hypothetical protein
MHGPGQRNTQMEGRKHEQGIFGSHAHPIGRVVLASADIGTCRRLGLGIDAGAAAEEKRECDECASEHRRRAGQGGGDEELLPVVPAVYDAVPRSP